MTMRTLFLALLLTLAFAGSAQAQQRVRTGPLRPAAEARAATRPLPARVVRQTKVHSSAAVGRAKGGPAASLSASEGRTVRRQHGPRTKRPAPRS
jgi:hypothetical protein